MEMKKKKFKMFFKKKCEIKKKYFLEYFIISQLRLQSCAERIVCIKILRLMEVIFFKHCLLFSKYGKL